MYLEFSGCWLRRTLRVLGILRPLAALFQKAKSWERKMGRDSLPTSHFLHRYHYRHGCQDVNQRRFQNPDPPNEKGRIYPQTPNAGDQFGQKAIRPDDRLAIL